MAAEGHTGQHSLQRLMPQRMGCVGKGNGCWKFMLELAIIPSPEGCGHPDSTSLGTRVSNDFPRELFIGKRSCDPLHQGCLIKKRSVRTAAKKTSVSGVAFHLGRDECRHRGRPRMQRSLCEVFNPAQPPVEEHPPRCALASSGLQTKQIPYPKGGSEEKKLAVNKRHSESHLHIPGRGAEVFLEGRHQRQQTDRQTAAQLRRSCRMFPAIGSWRREGVGCELSNSTWKRRGGGSRCLICRRRSWEHVGRGVGGLGGCNGEVFLFV